MDELDLWAAFIDKIGFPVVISIYLLVRFENKLLQLTKSINELIIAIQGMRK